MKFAKRGILMHVIAAMSCSKNTWFWAEGAEVHNYKTVKFMIIVYIIKYVKIHKQSSV